jgi:hypothetical protein
MRERGYGRRVLNRSTIRGTMGVPGRVWDADKWEGRNKEIDSWRLYTYVSPALVRLYIGRDTGRVEWQ